MSDYINREAAIADFEKHNQEKPVWTPQRVKTLLMRIQTADVEPVRRGNWNIRLSRKSTLCLVCSVCGRKVDNSDLRLLLELDEYGAACQLYPYCHCGAKMELEDGNGT